MTINLYLNTRPLKDGTCNIVFYLVNGRDFRKQIPTGMKIEKKHWDKKKQRVKASYSNYKILNHTLDELGLKIRTAQDKYDTKQYTEQQVMSFLEGKTNFDSVDDYIETEIKNSRSNPTYVDYRNAINSFKLYTGYENKKLKFEDVNYNLLDKFKRNSEKNGVAGSSFNSYLTKIRAVFNDAYNKGYIYEKFEIHKNLKASVVRKPIRTCTSKDFENAIKKIKNIYDAQALGLYLLMFSTRGMYPADIVNFKQANFENDGGDKSFEMKFFCEEGYDYLVHRRSKTKNRNNEDMYIKIDAMVLYLIQLLKDTFIYTHYKTKPQILAPLDESLGIFCYDAESDYKLHKNVWDTYAKRVSKILGYSFKTARKTFNTHALELQVSDTIRRVLLGHSDESMLSYYDNLNTQEIRQQVEQAHTNILKEFRVSKLIKSLKNKISTLDVPEVIYNDDIYTGDDIDTYYNEYFTNN